jgi:ribosomal protein L12E/L44/L45/RPP1/RPP2
MYDDENVEVEDVTYGELEFNLEGVSIEDLVAFHRIEVRLAKASLASS